MSDNSWNPWKMTAIGMALVMVTALVTGLVVANWSGSQDAEKVAADKSAAPAPAAPVTKPAVRSAPPAQRVVAATPPAAAPQPAPAPATQYPSAATPQPAMPSQQVVDACNQQAAQAPPTTKDKTVEVVKDAAIGAVVGAAVGAAGGAIAGGGKGAGKGAAIGGVLGAGGGTLYGINENRKTDERYREAYGACMRSRGYAS